MPFCLLFWVKQLKVSKQPLGRGNFTFQSPLMDGARAKISPSIGHPQPYTLLTTTGTLNAFYWILVILAPQRLPKKSTHCGDISYRDGNLLQLISLLV